MSSAIADEWKTNEEIEIFREYLRIPSVHPNIDYEPCVQFLRRQAAQLELPIRVHAADGDASKPVVIITWPGSDAAASSILLNSHMDVVPVYRDAWTHDPFAADMDDTGRIFARGAQDTKCVGVQYLAAIRQLRRDNFRPRRSVHVVFVPDEETGGLNGMYAFTKSELFRSLNVGFALDEGGVSADDEMPVYYAERAAWFLHIDCPGTTGHGSLMLEHTAGEKVAVILGHFLRFRQSEVRKMHADPPLSLGEVTTINLTMMEGGVQVNVVPNAMRLSFDIRLAVDVRHGDFEEMLRSWCRDAGDDVRIVFDFKTPPVAPTRLDDSNPFWLAFSKATGELNLKTVTRVLEGATDSSFLRELGIPAIGFSPINQTPVLLHDNDEFLSASTYLRGIQIYKAILANVANV